MGFPEEWCVMALNEKGNDVVNASTWIVDNLDLLSNMDENVGVDGHLGVLGGDDKGDGWGTRRSSSSSRARNGGDDDGGRDCGGNGTGESSAMQYTVSVVTINDSKQLTASTLQGGENGDDDTDSHKRVLTDEDVFSEEFFPNDIKVSGLNEVSETNSSGSFKALEREIAEKEVHEKYALVEDFLRSHFVRRIFIILLKRHTNCPSLKNRARMSLSDLSSQDAKDKTWCENGLGALLWTFAVPHISFTPHLCPSSVASAYGGANSTGSGGTIAGASSSTSSMQQPLASIDQDEHEHEIKSWRPRDILETIVRPAFKQLMSNDKEAENTFLNRIVKRALECVDELASIGGQMEAFNVERLDRALWVLELAVDSNIFLGGSCQGDGGPESMLYRLLPALSQAVENSAGSDGDIVLYALAKIATWGISQYQYWSIEERGDPIPSDPIQQMKMFASHVEEHLDTERMRSLLLKRVQRERKSGRVLHSKLVQVLLELMQAMRAFRDVRREEDVSGLPEADSEPGDPAEDEESDDDKGKDGKDEGSAPAGLDKKSKASILRPAKFKRSGIPSPKLAPHVWKCGHDFIDLSWDVPPSGLSYPVSYYEVCVTDREALDMVLLAATAGQRKLNCSDQLVHTGRSRDKDEKELTHVQVSFEESTPCRAREEERSDGRVCAHLSCEGRSAATGMRDCR